MLNFMVTTLLNVCMVAIIPLIVGFENPWLLFGYVLIYSIVEVFIDRLYIGKSIKKQGAFVFGLKLIINFMWNYILFVFVSFIIGAVSNAFAAMFLIILALAAVSAIEVAIDRRLEIHGII